MLHDAILPAVADRSQVRHAAARDVLDGKRRKAPDFNIGDEVMAVDPVRTSKWHPVFTGPHTLSEVHEGSTYTLLDALGEPMQPRRTTDMLRLARKHTTSMVSPSGGEERSLVPPKSSKEEFEEPHY